MSKEMTIKEAKAMEGTEFIYIYEDGDEIPAYVKKFDPEIGLTCMSLEEKTRDGWVNKFSEKEADGTYCVFASNFTNIPKYDTKRKAKAMKETLEILQEIKDTGKHKCAEKYIGIPICAFI